MTSKQQIVVAVLCIYPYDCFRLGEILSHHMMTVEYTTSYRNKITTHNQEHPLWRSDTMEMTNMVSEYVSGIPQYYAKTILPILTRYNVQRCNDPKRLENYAKILLEKRLGDRNGRGGKRQISHSFEEDKENGEERQHQQQLQVLKDNVEKEEDSGEEEEEDRKLEWMKQNAVLKIKKKNKNVLEDLTREEMDDLHSKPIAEMGNYVAVLRSKHILRDPFSEDEKSNRKVNFGSRYKKGKQSNKYNSSPLLHYHGSRGWVDEQRHRHHHRRGYNHHRAGEVENMMIPFMAVDEAEVSRLDDDEEEEQQQQLLQLQERNADDDYDDGGEIKKVVDCDKEDSQVILENDDDDDDYNRDSRTNDRGEGGDLPRINDIDDADDDNDDDECETVRSENDHNNTNFKNERPSMRAGKDCVSKKRRHSIQFWRKNSLREVKKLAVSLFRSNITARQIKQQVLQKQYQQKVTYLVELIRSISDANPTEQRMKKQYISTLFDGLARRHNNSNVGILLKQRLADG
eukprot:jgi/Bigna1/145918/aug1.105_g20626